jgi:hypothetical protein
MRKEERRREGKVREEQEAALKASVGRRGGQDPTYAGPVSIGVTKSNQDS